MKRGTGRGDRHNCRARRCPELPHKACHAQPWPAPLAPRAPGGSPTSAPTSTTTARAARATRDDQPLHFTRSNQDRYRGCRQLQLWGLVRVGNGLRHEANQRHDRVDRRRGQLPLPVDRPASGPCSRTGSSPGSERQHPGRFGGKLHERRLRAVPAVGADAVGVQMTPVQHAASAAPERTLVVPPPRTGDGDRGDHRRFRRG